MPLQRCGEGGWRWGKEGKCYTGPGAKKKAIKQGIVIEGPKKFAAKAGEGEEAITKGDMHDFGLDSESTLEELTILAEVVGLSLAERMALDFTRKRIEEARQDGDDKPNSAD